MVSAWGKNQVREIQKSLGRYLAILGIVALGIGFFAGLKVTGPSMLYTGGQYTEETALFDLRLVSTLGWTREDAAFFAGQPGIEAAEGASSLDICVQVGEREVTLRALPISAQVNKPALTAGRLPVTDGECLGDSRLFLEEAIGNVLTVTRQERDGALTEQTLTLVGLCSSPLYLNESRGTTTLGDGTLDGFLYLPMGCFGEEIYTELNLRLKNMDRDLYSEDYDAQIAEALEAWKPLAQQRAELRYETVVSQAREELNKAQAEYDRGLQEYETAKAEAEAGLEDARIALEQGEAELKDGQEELEAGRAALEQAKRDLEAGRRDYAQGLREYEAKKAEAEEQLAAAQAELDKNWTLVEEGMAQAEASGLPQLHESLVSARDFLKVQWEAQTPGTEEYALFEKLFQGAQEALSQLEATEAYQQYRALLDAKAALEAGQAELDIQKAQAEAQLQEAAAQLAEAKNQLESGESQIAENERALKEGAAQLAEAEETLAQGRKDYEAGLEEAKAGYAEAEQTLNEGKTALDQAEKQLADLPKPEVFLLDRGTNMGYLSFQSDSGIVDGVAKVFPLFFFLVAAFVCITTMTRMVDEQRTQIGTFKALGYTDRRITEKFMIYSGSAAIIGCTLGFAIGTRLFPWVIWECYDLLYGFAPLQFSVSPLLGLLCLGAALLCSVGTTWLACRTELRRMPSALMRPKAPKAGKRILLERVPLIWNRFSFLYKVSIRNIVRYKKRLIMMLVGISGCTALIATGFGVRDSIANIAGDQFDEITVYDMSVTFREPLDEQAQQAFRDTFAGELTQCVFVGTDTKEARREDGIRTVNVVATSDENLTQVIRLHHEGKELAFPQEGAIIDEALAKDLGLSVGDALTLNLSDTETLDIPVSGICDNYLYHYAYLSESTYEALFGTPCQYKTAYLSADDGLSAQVSSYDNVASVTVLEDLRQMVDRMMQSLNALVYVVIGSACALAFIVVYNLTNITITERVREIATLKVLGFYERETGAYVSREILILTVLGALAGLPMGKALHSFVMAQIKVDLVSFHVRIAPLSYVLAFGITVVLAVGTNLLLRPKLRAIHMAESLKSVE